MIKTEKEGRPCPEWAQSLGALIAGQIHEAACFNLESTRDDGAPYITIRRSSSANSVSCRARWNISYFQNENLTNRAGRW